jgi:phosphoglycerate dehydrogenase-like enzyme
MKKILIGYPLDRYKAFEDILLPLPNEYSVVFKDYDYKWLKDNIQEFEIVVPSLKVIVDDAIINKAENLRLLFTPTTGRDHIRIEKSRKKIKILTLNDYRKEIDSINSTAELGFSLLLSLSRKMLHAHRDVVESARWERNEFLGTELNHKVIGIIGMGRIGRKISRYGQAFGMEVVYWDRIKRGKEKRVSRLSKLLSIADFIIVSVTLTGKTRYLINMNNIGDIKKGAILVNISRGEVIEEKSLCSALKKGILSGVGVDVLEKELLDYNKSPLLVYARRNPEANIIITPHIGGATIEAWKKVFKLVCDKISEEMTTNEN